MMSANMIKSFIQTKCYRLKEGEMFQICPRKFAQAFPCGWPSIYETHEQAFLSSMISSAYGAWKISNNIENNTITISRHKPDGRIHYVDPDRMHLYKQIPDGTYESRK